MKIDIFNYMFDSPLEEIFAQNFVKYLNDSIVIEPQFEINTICGKFRIDFTIEYCSKVIGFECDGKKYHDEARDEWRDAMILGTKTVDTIYRLRGSDLYNHLEDCFYVISKYNPEIFSDRGLKNIEQLASNIVRNTPIDPHETIVMITYQKENKSIPEPPYIFIVRHLMKSLKNKKNFYQDIYKYAKSNGGGNLDQMIKKYYKENYS